MSGGNATPAEIDEARELMFRLFSGLQLIANRNATQRPDDVATPSVLHMLQHGMKPHQPPLHSDTTQTMMQPQVSLALLSNHSNAGAPDTAMGGSQAPATNGGA